MEEERKEGLELHSFRTKDEWVCTKSMSSFARCTEQTHLSVPGRTFKPQTHRPETLLETLLLKFTLF